MMKRRSFLKDGSIAAAGLAVGRSLGLSLQAPEVDTIAGWMIAQLGSLPREGEQIKTDNVRATARKVVKNRVREVLLEIED